MASAAAQAGPSRQAAMPIPRGETFTRMAFSDDEESGLEEESGSDEEFESAEQDSSPSPAPARDVKGKAPASASPSTQSTHLKSAKRAGSWADLDLSIIVALVSPIGNWLTGGDHIKNLFLIILLIFYLHQIVEIPWQLYLSSRPRKQARRHVSKKHDDAQLAHFTALAENELRRHELFYLALAIASPFIGATFLRYVLSTLGDNHALSWFSTTLFVLATGIRPWTHLVNRLNDRTQELHDALHAPSEEDLAHAQEETQRTLSAALQRIAALERECRDLREAVQRAEQLREVCDDLSEILGDVERATKRNERKADTVRSAIGARIAAVELGLVHLERRRQEDMAAIEATGFRFPRKSVLFVQAREYAWLLAQKVLSYPRTLLWVLGVKDPFATKPPNSPRPGGNTAVHEANGNGTAQTTGILLNRIQSPERGKHVAHTAPSLATIPEADDSDSEGTFVSDKDGTGARKGSLSRSRSRSRSRSSSSGTRPRKASTYGQYALGYAQGAVLWPYRLSTRILVAVLPPVERFVPKL